MCRLISASPKIMTGYTPTARVESSIAAFNASLSTDVLTRSVTDVPDKLYSLEIRQYNSDGKYIAVTGNDFGDKALGEHLTVTLKAMDDCQLLLVARGNGGAIGALGSKSLDEIRKMSVSSSVISAIDPFTGDMNKMPYVLHLEHVKVAVVGGKAMIQSPEGDFDTRLLLKRLATRLTVNWEMSGEITPQDYALKEVKLCQVPANFSVIPTKEKTSEWGVTYPSSVAEFIDYYRLTDTELANAKGTKTVWIPANVRGSSPKATSPYYRTKENAPTASSYVELVVDNSVKQERLYYRAYLGGEESTDFNLYENKNYNWTIKVSSANYRDDGRIQLLDQTPVTSTNLVPTSNCFMMIPGTNICFNPYKHEAGTNGWNTYLTNGTTLASDKTIASVQVMWQTKDTGTSGDLVMGYVIDNDHHENLVNVSDIGNKDNALVHVKVPVTKGGNALIEAKNSSNAIIWSWHIWVTDYVPKGMEGTITPSTRAAAIENARASTQQGTVHTYGGVSWTKPTGAFYNCVIMDRNLGAIRAGIQSGLTDAVRTFGLLYQGARKEPFFSTADGTASEVKTIYDGEGITIEGGVKKDQSTSCTLDQTIQNPLTHYAKMDNSNYTGTWGGDNAKTLYDPCPKGWRVPSNTDVNDPYVSFIAGFGGEPTDTYGNDPYKASYKKNIMYYNGTGFIELKYENKTQISSSVVGSGFMYFGDDGENPDQYTDKSAYFPGLSLREVNGNYREKASNNTVYLWSSSPGATSGCLNHAQIQYDPANYKPEGNGIVSTKQNQRSYGFSVRCIQDRLQKGKAE